MSFRYEVVADLEATVRISDLLVTRGFASCLPRKFSRSKLVASFVAQEPDRRLAVAPGTLAAVIQDLGRPTSPYTLLTCDPDPYEAVEIQGVPASTRADLPSLARVAGALLRIDAGNLVRWMQTAKAGRTIPNTPLVLQTKPGEFTVCDLHDRSERRCESRILGGAVRDLAAWVPGTLPEPGWGCACVAVGDPAAQGVDLQGITWDLDPEPFDVFFSNRIADLVVGWLDGLQTTKKDSLEEVALLVPDLALLLALKHELEKSLGTSIRWRCDDLLLGWSPRVSGLEVIVGQTSRSLIIDLSDYPRLSCTVKSRSRGGQV